MAEQQVAQQLQGLMAAGFVRLEGDRYQTTARFESGKLFVNDQEIPLAPAMDQESSNDVETMPMTPDDGGEAEGMPSAPGSDAEKPSQEKPTLQ